MRCVWNDKMLRNFLFLLILCNLSSIYGEVEKYFKVITNKADIHQIKNIDFIYTINLDERPEKWESCKQQLAIYGIEPYRFSAVNGWELPLEAFSELGVKLEPWMSKEKWGTYYSVDSEGVPQHEQAQTIGRTYFCHCMSRGAVGIALSHLSILRDAYNSGYETIWVMEDDIDIMRNPHCLSDYIEQLDGLVGREGWDVLFTDPDTKNQQGAYVPCYGFAWRPDFFPDNPGRFAVREQISPDFRRVGARFGAYSMIVRRSGMKKILEFLTQYHIFLPYDIDFTFPNDIRFYTVLTDIVSTQPQALSDNGAPTYKKQLTDH